MSDVIEVCRDCKGSGLSRCDENHNIKAINHSKYIVCSRCYGEGEERWLTIPDFLRRQED